MLKYYVDAENGSDTLGNGSKSRPYSSIANLVTSLNNEILSCMIMLGDGEYTLESSLITSIVANGRCIVIGNGKSTTLKLTGNYTNYEGKGNNTATIEFSRLIFNGTTLDYVSYKAYAYNTPHYCKFNPAIQLKFSNCAISGRISLVIKKQSSYNPANQYFFTASNKVTFKNCVFINKTFTCKGYSRSTNDDAGIWSDSYNGNYYKTVTISGSSYSLVPNSSNVSLINCYGMFNTTNTLDALELNENNVNTTTACLNDDIILSNEDYKILNESVDTSIVGLYVNEYSWGFSKYVIYSNNKFYSINESNYNTETQMFNEISQADVINHFEDYCSDNMRDFDTNELTIGEETFKPIDKFDSFQIASINPIDVSVNGIIKQSSLIVQSFDILANSIKTITGLTITTDTDDENSIKIAMSFNMGETWWSYSNGSVTPLDCVIPVKSYDNMNDTEKAQFNSAITSIKENGIDIKDFPDIDLNSILFQKLRLAFVITRESYSSKSNLSAINISYDEADNRVLMEDSEYDVELFTNAMKVTSNIDSSNVKIAIII